MVNISSHQLYVFLVAAETMNYTQAAQRLDISQPSVSQHIQALEEHFDLPLFVRSGRRVELTDAGAILVPLARELIDISEHIEETMNSLKGDVFGKLVVGCATVTGRYLLPQLLAGFHRLCPQVHAICHVSTREWVLQATANGEIHVGLVSDLPVHPGLEFHQFGEEQLVLITPMDHPWGRRGEIAKEELPEEGFILPEEGSDSYSDLSRGLAKCGLGIQQLKKAVTLGSQEAIALSVMEGLGVGFVPQLLASRLVQGRVALARVRGIDVCTALYASRAQSRRRGAAQEAFWEFIIQEEMQKR